MKNIEIKVKVNNFASVKSVFKKIGAKNHGTFVQRDTYFKCEKGRLKLREINKKHHELIFYERPNKKGTKISKYKIIVLTNNTKKEIPPLLKNICRIIGLVNKKRNLWIYKNTRIHLDKVNRLGNFLELETIVKKDIEKAKEEYKTVYKLLNLKKHKTHSGSYIDLLVKK